MRTRHKRAPKPALEGPSPDAARPGIGASTGASTGGSAGQGLSGQHFGGFSIDRAAKHLDKFYGDSKPDARDENYFRITRSLVVATRRWRKLANDRVRGVGQNMARWETLYLLACADEALNQGELAKLVGVKGPSMVHMLDSLAREGLIERQQSGVDRRVTHNRITEQGRQVTRDIMAVTNELRTELLCDIDPAKLAVTLEVLESIHAKLDELC